MQLTKSLASSAVIAVLVLGLPVAAKAAPSVESDSQALTLADLQAALEGESNASAKYEAFARKADEEKLPGIASLFRAAARAEKIHADNHAEVIRALGGTPVVRLAGIVAGSTRENLESAIKGESYERDTMYPLFLTRAKAAGLKEAVRTFNYARTAEMEHAKLYQGALALFEQGKDLATSTYYVCTVCGYTTTKLDFKKCPSCFNSKERYVTVS